MKLPERLTTNSFAHWNFLVRGLIEVWEIADSSGWARDLERLLEEDQDGALAEELGRLGNELLNLQLKNARGSAGVTLWAAETLPSLAASQVSSGERLGADSRSRLIQTAYV